MALSAKNRTEIVGLIAREVDFERSGISARVVRDATACPRQGELTDAEYEDLMNTIGFNDVRYIVFSYTTPIAWVHRRHEGVTLVTRKFTGTTSQHQKMVLEAFGEGRVNTRTPQPKGESEVQLSENEEIILRRMRDEYGTEYCMVMGAGVVPNSKKAPRDQVEPLIAKGLVAVREADSGTVDLTDKGRAHLDKIQPVVSQEAQVSQYVELTEDELIAIASDLGDRVTASTTAVESRRASLELVAVIGALKARREVTAPARRRIGEYLRQQALVEAKYEADISSDSDYAKRNAKPVRDVRDEVRADKYAQRAILKLSDLRRIVTPVVRDTKAEFEAEQQRRLELWQAQGLPEKQAALLECIAKGHMAISTYNGRSYHGDYSSSERCQKCQRPDGRTMDALRRKNVFTEMPSLTYQVGGRMNTLMLTDPEKTDQ